MMISLYREQIFLMNAKAASHTMRELLGRNIEWCSLGDPYKPVPHHSTRIPIAYQHFETFVVVRNPYSRAVSHWAHDSRNGGIPSCEFPEYVQHHICGLLQQTAWLKHVRVDRVLHFENLVDDLKRVRLITDTESIPQLNGSEHGPWASYYTDELADLVRAYYAADFTEYGYSPEVTGG